MEFSISSTSLLKGLLDVSKAIPAKTPLPILENFLLVLRGNELEITASDQELTLRTVINTDSTGEDGSIAAPSKQMMDLLKTLPDQPVTIRTTGEGSFECRWASGNSSLPFFPAEDYPEIQSAADYDQTVVFPAQVLADGISGTIYATADDEMRPTMNGIFFDLTPESTTLVASDSHKLICYSCSGVQVEQAASFILHKKPAAVIRSIVDKREDDVNISFNGSNVVFSVGQTLMVCRLIVGKYPKYRDVIPQNNSNILRIDRELLLGTVKRVAVCANKASNHIKFELNPGQLEVTAQDLGFALAAYEKVGCDYSGSSLSIGFKSSFLIEILANMSCSTVVMKFASAKSAALIVPSEEDAETEKICGILMPIMVS